MNIALVDFPAGTNVTERWEFNGASAGFRVTFPNGFGLSIAQGPFTYGGASGLFEALPILPGGAFEDEGIKGWLTVEDVQAFACEVAAR